MSVKHGTAYGYNKGCRCDKCREAKTITMYEFKRYRVMRAAKSLLKGKDFIPHGTITGYASYDCRCEPCRDARTKYYEESGK